MVQLSTLVTIILSLNLLGLLGYVIYKMFNPGYCDACGYRFTDAEEGVKVGEHTYCRGCAD